MTDQELLAHPVLGPLVRVVTRMGMDQATGTITVQCNEGHPVWIKPAYRLHVADPADLLLPHPKQLTPAVRAQALALAALLERVSAAGYTGRLIYTVTAGVVALDPDWEGQVFLRAAGRGH